MGDVLLSGRGYLQSISNLRQISPPAGVDVAARKEWFDTFDLRSPTIAMGIGGSGAAACFLSRCLVTHRNQSSIYGEFDEVDLLNNRHPDINVILVTASGQNPSTGRAVLALAQRKASFAVVTLNPESIVARQVREVDPSRLVAPSVNLYQNEYIATQNLLNLLWLESELVCGNEIASTVFSEVRDAVVRACDAKEERGGDDITRVVVISDSVGRSPALDFSTRCREFARTPVTDLRFSEFVHGAHAIARALSASDNALVAVFMNESDSRPISELLGSNIPPERLCVIPIAGNDAISQSRGIAASISLHYRLVAGHWDSWTTEQDKIGAGLWAGYR